MSIDKVQKPKRDGSQDFDTGEKRIGHVPNKLYITQLEKTAKHILPENIKAMKC